MIHLYRNWYYPLISFSVALGISVGTPQTAVAVPWFELLIGGTQIVQLYNISDEEEVQLGTQINDQIIGREFQLDRNANVNRYVNRIGQRLAKNSTRPNIPYSFQVVRDRNVNAFATMGGFVYVTTGLLNKVDAGYPQIALVQFLEKLRNQPSPPAFLSTHPATGDRIARLKEIINSQQANR